MTIQAHDLISRCIIYDKAFYGALHTDSRLFIFGETRDDGASHESGVLRRLAPLDADVHEIGCEIASLQNQRKGNPSRGLKRRYYCGFRTARMSAIPSRGDGYEVRLKLDGDGHPAHVDIALFVSSQDKNERATIKVDAGMAVAEAFGEATPHICESDRGDENHPLIKDPECLRRGIPRLDSLVIGAGDN